MDSQQEYEALLAKWGFDSESQTTANKFYELTQKVNGFTSKLIEKLQTGFKAKPQNLQLGLSH